MPVLHWEGPLAVGCSSRCAPPKEATEREPTDEVTMSRRRSWLVGLTAVLLLAACTAESDTSSADAAAGPPVTDRSFETFDGTSTSLPAFAGEPLVVNFWASWCPPCIAEMPEFERVHVDRRDEVRFIGINTQDDLEQATALAERTGVSYDLGLDPDGALFNDFEVIAMPSTYFVNAAGAVVHRHAGILSEQQLQDLIDEHLIS
jgi:cytochrome c biogenesis protein CcmG, thiol:disulfide interchange protein DsbE